MICKDLQEWTFLYALRMHSCHLVSLQLCDFVSFRLPVLACLSTNSPNAIHMEERQ